MSPYTSSPGAKSVTSDATSQTTPDTSCEGIAGVRVRVSSHVNSSNVMAAACTATDKLPRARGSVRGHARRPAYTRATPPVCPQRDHAGQGSCQSIGSASIFASSSLARLNGRDPKNPRDADSGEGCRRSIATQLPSARMGLSVDASRPQRIATIGCERATSTRSALGDRLQSLTAVRRRITGPHRQHSVQQQHTALGPRSQIAAPRAAYRGRRCTRRRCWPGSAAADAHREQPRSSGPQHVPGVG